MQQQWSDIDSYIESHLIPQDPILSQTIQNTHDKGLADILPLRQTKACYYKC